MTHSPALLRSRWPQLLTGLAASSLVFTAPAQADTLETWRFDNQQNRLDFATDQGVQPIAILVENPTRVVVDLPGIRLKRPKINQPFGNGVKAVRIAQFNPFTTRLVIELEPGYTVDPQAVKIQGSSLQRWTVELPKLARTATASAPNPNAAPIAIAVTPPPADTFGGLVPAGQPLAWLQQRIASLSVGRYASLGPSLFFLDLDTGNYLNLAGDQVFPTASIIKLPILIAFFQEVEAGRIRLNETLVMSRDVIVGGSGYMQDQPVGSRYSALQTVTNMIITSDNTATNMIIKRLGGIAPVNRRFREWGLKHTVIRNWLPDLRGTNTTTARELVQVIAMLEKGKLLGPQAKEQALGIMKRVKNRSLLPVGIGRGAVIAHKTGDIGFMLGDAGIVYMPNGKRYLAAVMVKSAYNDYAARDYVQDVSRIVYAYLSDVASQSSPVGPQTAAATPQ